MSSKPTGSMTAHDTLAATIFSVGNLMWAALVVFFTAVAIVWFVRRRRDR